MNKKKSKMQNNSIRQNIESSFLSTTSEYGLVRISLDFLIKNFLKRCILMSTFYLCELFGI